MKNKSNLFSSWLMAGYECTYALAADNKRLDLLAATKHDTYCREDYKMLDELHIKTVREGLSWHEIDKGNNTYDFSRFEKMMQIAKLQNVQQIWDLNHFDYPAYIDPFSEKFVQQFAEYSRHVIHLIRKYQKGTLYIVPQNEISYFSYKGADKGGWAPYTYNRGMEFKVQLVKASIAAMDAIWEEDKDVRFIQVDPIFYRTQKEPFSPEKAKLEEDFQNIRFMSWDMLCGKLMPELGGNPKYLDIIGANYYIQNQEWIIGTDRIDRSSYQNIPWDHPDRISVAQMFKEVYDRYHRPIVMTESGCCKDLRSQWWARTFIQLDEARAAGIPVEGVCAYPILDMYDWHTFELTHPGIWDFKEDDPKLQRIQHTESVKVIKDFLQI